LNKTEEKRIKEKIEFFLSKKIKVHITTQTKRVHNGYFTGNVVDNIYSFKDDEQGEIEIFVSDIFDIIRFVNKKRGGSE
jgi:nitrogen regulatory protein PII